MQLIVRGATHLWIKDTESIGQYDFNTCKHDPQRGRLVILTGVPLRFEIAIAHLEVCVTVIANA